MTTTPPATAARPDPVTALLLMEIRAGYFDARQHGARPDEVTADILQRRQALQEIRGRA